MSIEQTSTLSPKPIDFKPGKMYVLGGDIHAMIFKDDNQCREWFPDNPSEEGRKDSCPESMGLLEEEVVMFVEYVICASVEYRKICKFLHGSQVIYTPYPYVMHYGRPTRTRLV